MEEDVTKTMRNSSEKGVNFTSSGSGRGKPSWINCGLKKKNVGRGLGLLHSRKVVVGSLTHSPRGVSQ